MDRQRDDRLGGVAGPSLDTGGRYTPGSDSWTATTTTNAPEARYGHTAVWTGSEMIVWGGSHGPGLDTGGRYDPGGDGWTATATTNAPRSRHDHTAVWTGSEMIVWGGVLLNSMGVYYPGVPILFADGFETE